MNMGVETEKIEFKKTTGELREGITSLASMLNKNSYGVLYFGVKNNGDVVGQQMGDRTLREISQAIASYIKPQVIPVIEHQLIDDKNVIKIEVRGSEKPYSAYGRYYMRSADEDRELSPTALKELMDKQTSSDILTFVPAPVQKLTFNKLKIAYVTSGLTVNQATFEDNVGLKNSDGKYNLMAFLLADENDISIKVVTFAGKDKTDLIKRNEYGGTCLVTAIDKVLDYMESINETMVKMGNHRRTEEKLFDMASFKEAWQNACIHTKWDKGNPPAVYIFSDRIEIISTGGLPVDLNKEEFYKGISKPVNSKLQKIFGQLGYVEQTGHGIPLIISNYGKQAFDIMENFVNVTIPFNYEKNNVTELGIQGRTSLNEAEQRVVGYISKNSNITIRELVMQSGYSDGYIRKIITSLKKKKVLERQGGNKMGKWVLKNMRAEALKVAEGKAEYATMDDVFED
ncbi:RNA-binding domain-containing protein [Anaerovibrio sp. RM50]|uniref:RNA-binding domain-containing protein n=1 Tax=Anaerovibrio sp. RM50 TaxID=1200557 RepID=UPI000687E01E|nr:RNA-binding domain-containing protein [Anaerovibrio sp. RM50]